jgi:hypothetical protein
MPAGRRAGGLNAVPVSIPFDASARLRIERCSVGLDACQLVDQREKLATSGRVTGTKQATFLTMVTTQGVKANEFSEELVQNSVRVDALFAA